jgi:hypothetical protein
MGGSGRVSPTAGAKEAAAGAATADNERIVTELLTQGRKWWLSPEELGTCCGDTAARSEKQAAGRKSGSAFAGHPRLYGLLPTNSCDECFACAI